MRTKIILLFVLLFTSQNVFAGRTKSLHWKIRNQTWETYHEVGFQNFIHTLGIARKNGKCKTLDECLRSPIANPTYYQKNPSRLNNIFSDCADLPFTLRAYFSWMNDLPFSYPTELVEATNFSSNKNDIRYSKYGNIVREKSYVHYGENVNKILQDVSDTISTASYRTDASKNDTGELFRDTYPADINRNSIVPGTIVYDPNGHVAVVYDVTLNGKILMIDAHPDNSLSAITYGEKFARSSIKIGGGFSNFRPYYLSGYGVTPRSNSELPNYSLIQYQKGPFIFKGQQLSFYDYVRNKLADGDIIYDPIAEFTSQMEELCQDVKYREDAVNVSVLAGVQYQSHPYLLPENIYGADGDWETYATPARDARLKESVSEMKKFLTKVITGQVRIEYNGEDLVTELRNIYLTKSASCTVMATSTKSINLDFVLMNLFAISFDPYHCAELRWGLGNTMSCGASYNKMSWYVAEQGLRNRIDRDNTIKTDYDVSTLPNAPVSQVEKPDLSFDKILEIVR